MATPTERLGLARPDDNSTDWGDDYRAAMTTLDTAIAELQDRVTEEGAEPPVFIQPTEPDDPGPYFWIRTGLEGGGFALFFHDGLP